MQKIDYIQGEKFIELANNFNIYYCKTELVNRFFYEMKINYDFVLISHNSDGKIQNHNSQFGANINNIPPNLIKWFGQNVCVIHDKVESIPIGLENSQWFPEINKIDKMKQIIKTEKNHKNLLYINHNINTNPNERQMPYDLFKYSNFVDLDYGINGSGFDGYLNNIYNHKFVLSPEGNGTDTHRLWECLYLNTIPIEKRNINNQFYIDLPICFIDDWSEITEKFLESEFDRITSKSWNLEKLDFNYWKNKITSCCL